MEQEFQLYPAGVGQYVGPGNPVTADMSRQVADRECDLNDGVVSQSRLITFPTQGWNRFEIATDDADSDPNTEDNVPAPGKDHVYSLDSPSFNLTVDDDFCITRASFREFARFKFGPNQSFVKDGFNVDGSRGSPLVVFNGGNIEEDPDSAWHYIQYVRRDQDGLNESGTYARDAANPSASFAILYGDGTGTCVGAPNASNAVTEGWTVVYNAMTDTWSVTGSKGSTGYLTRTGARLPWTGVARKSGADMISLVVTPGGTAFGTGDHFEFSTFKSGTTKANEIGAGDADILVGP
jgi:hypothetical protein